MIGATATSVHRLADRARALGATAVMPNACPVPYFGELRKSRIATLGINPSNREFVDDLGMELVGDDRRFPTLSSLGLTEWGEASSCDIEEIIDACDTYFLGNPYDRWFKVLDRVIAGAGATYYCPTSPASHLDLVPFATSIKWGALQAGERRTLLECGGDVLGALLRDSSVDFLVLNGRSVVREFERVSGSRLSAQRCPSWDLGREGSRTVEGWGFVGSICEVGGVPLGRTIAVLGFNLNVQSSFGVTRDALDSLAKWISSQVNR